MAFFPTNQNLFSVVLAIFITSFLLLATELVNSQKTCRVFLHSGILLISNPAYDKYGSGRALYSTPVPIWDKTTGNVASFVTSFTFQVSNFKNFYPGSGFIFFLTPTDKANIPPTSYGANLGVVDDNNAYNQFYKHIGINVGSLISLRTVKWNRVSGALVDVNISYDSLSKTLNVIVSYPDGTFSTIAQVIDLKAVLPDTVRIGFSGTSSSVGTNLTQVRQLQYIHSWSFKSNLATTKTTISDNIASF
ncbi:putative concanavalin A-like lectin/glucanase domain-containing protein [Medicago truncatula]|uniref:Putative concanavalin A-like lectin/glucanase domain-containing protein n=1 Tax=Medicago truncatula TaxID=3880 RepID=A0A396JSM9_MEDTR|nr:putative concanavalin A-like lectin/glucanase domain-containing protein [Medicago truncatula]